MRAWIRAHSSCSGGAGVAGRRSGEEKGLGPWLERPSGLCWLSWPGTYWVMFNRGQRLDSQRRRAGRHEVAVLGGTRAVLGAAQHVHVHHVRPAMTPSPPSTECRPPPNHGVPRLCPSTSRLWPAALPGTGLCVRSAGDSPSPPWIPSPLRAKLVCALKCDGCEDACAHRGSMAQRRALHTSPVTSSSRCCPLLIATRNSPLLCAACTTIERRVWSPTTCPRSALPCPQRAPLRPDVHQILSVRHNADPLLSAFQPVRAGKLTSVATMSLVLVRSIPHLYKLAQYPVVIHVSVEPAGFPDFSDITAVRQCGFIFLQSETLQQALDISLTSHALAIRSGKGVIHFFDSGAIASSRPIALEDRNLVAQLLDVHGLVALRKEASGEDTLYANDGRKAMLSVARSQMDAAHVTPGQPAGSASNKLAATLDRTSARASSTGSSQRESSAASRASHSSATTVESLASRPLSSDDIYRFVTQIWAAIKDATGRSYDAFEYTGPPNPEMAVFLFGADTALFATEIDSVAPTEQYANAGIITARLYRPWLGASLAPLLPKSIKRIAVLEQIRRKTTKWGPLLLDLLMSLKASGSAPIIVGYQLGYISESTVRQALRGVFQNLLLDPPIQNLHVGNLDGPRLEPIKLEQPALENAYMKILAQLFGDKLHVVNQLNSKNTNLPDHLASAPEFGLGSLLARKERRLRFVDEVSAASKSQDFATAIPPLWLRKWAQHAEDGDKANELAPEVIARLSIDGSSAANRILAAKSLLFQESSWIIGSDAWAYDLGNSGVHHVLASGENVNMLIIDSQPYSERAAADAARRKKDIGLYAMNFGNAYVASVAVYGLYTHVLEAMIEADRFDGPSIVLAYLPYDKESDSPLTVLQETKKAVDIGYWPLYRWDPRGDEKGEPNFQLDSDRIRKELEDFLKRDNYLFQVMRRHPEFSANLSGILWVRGAANSEEKGKGRIQQAPRRPVWRPNDCVVCFGQRQRGEPCEAPG